MLDAYMPDDPEPRGAGAVRGLISPHIDYARGGHVYARVWARAVGAARAAELAVILGTDHVSEGQALALTRQHYATPYGVLPTAVDAVDTLVEALGAEAALDGELHHRTEHSIELAAVWLHHVRGGEPCELLPILCGPFHRSAPSGLGAYAPLDLDALLDALRAATAGRRTLVVASADLAHVGPAFGGRPVDMVGRARLQAADDALLAHICAGDAEGFMDQIRRVDDRNNVCGVTPIYLALRLLAPVTGVPVAYDRCPADERGASLVSICGVQFGG
jgi:AmmeMemoRadiSam system protein B